ncbi:MAG TPA: hypothetical protein VF541_11005, partial [Longimicrobium sp.]
QREESALQGFRVQTITLPADRGSPVTPGLEVTQDPVFNNFFNLNMEREQIQRDRDEIARAMALGGAAGTTALEAIPSVQKSSALNQALQELTAKRAELRAMQGQFTELYQPLQRLRGRWKRWSGRRCRSSRSGSTPSWRGGSRGSTGW